MGFDKDIRELRKALADVDPTQTNIVIIADDKDRDDQVIQRLNLHQDLAADFHETAFQVANSMADGKRFRHYEAGYKPDSDEVLVLEYTTDETINSAVESVSRVGQAELFTADSSVIAGLRCYAVVVQLRSGQPAVFFRKFGPKSELSQHGKFVTFLARGHYNRIREKAFLFDSKVDCVAYNGMLFINSANNFYRIFRYFEQLRVRADEILGEVTKRVPVQNVEDLRQACKGQLQMLSKLQQISRKPYFNWVTMDDVERTINEFQLDVKVVGKKGDRKLVFEPGREKRWLILKLLDDDYLGSNMTGHQYETNSKSLTS